MIAQVSITLPDFSVFCITPRDVAPEAREVPGVHLHDIGHLEETVQQNIREAGEGLVKSIVRLIEGEPVESVKLQPKLIVRRSCGAKT